MPPVLNAAFYRFLDLAERVPDLAAFRVELRAFCSERDLKGTILLSSEGINASVAGEPGPTRELIAGLEARLAIDPPLDVKWSDSDHQPFGRMKIKLKREIIALGRPDVRPHERTGVRLPARELKRWLDEGKPVLLVDTRNDYEIRAGAFEGALDLGLRRFRQFPEKLPEIRAHATRGVPVVMYCTGGIRCEKATALAALEGIEDVYQLEGGILRYLEECGDAHYRGKCFVFDERVALGAGDWSRN